MKSGDVCWVDFPSRGGHEQAGRRPAVVLQSAQASAVLPTTLVIPLTTQIAALRFPGTVLVETDTENGLRRTSVALVFQLTAVDQRFVSCVNGAISEAVFRDIWMALNELGHEPETEATE